MTTIFKRILWCISLSALLITVGLAYESYANDAAAHVLKDRISCSDGWTRPSMFQSSNSAVYMNIANNTDQDISLLSASAPQVSGHVELHKTFTDEKGITKMAAIDKILIPAHSKISLAPQGLHVMLFHVNTMLQVGDSFNVELHFENIDTVKVPIEVKKGK